MPRAPVAGDLRLETFRLPDPTDVEVLAEPIYGCWEGNMSHALLRDPVDVCHLRQEEKVVLGNAGVVRVLRPGAAVQGVKEGDLCLVFCSGEWDERGYPRKIYGYDARGSVGLLARRTKLHERQLIRVPAASRHSLRQWAAFSLRYVTAWANWKVAYACWRSLVADDSDGHERAGDGTAPCVWGWGGGVTLAELTLARHAGCRASMLSADPNRLACIERLGINAVDRRNFGDLRWDPQRYQSDEEFRCAYQAAEESFIAAVREQTGGAGVSIFVDLIGRPVFRATLKALGRPGVIATAGWKAGMELTTVRALECMNWHVHVHTHYARFSEGPQAVRYGEEHGWMPPVGNEDPVCPWESIPNLAREHARGKSSSFFPIYQVNDL
jgi:NADPH:quinone reductase-like Zn-dependent oxidoreductase